MNTDLQNKLYEKYPDFFKNKDLGIQKSCMARGIECDDGWFDLIEAVCSTIQNFIKHNTSVTFEFDQIKEKFGGLRIYYSSSNNSDSTRYNKDYIHGVIQLAENISFRICEQTGNKGGICKKGNWLKTLSPAKMSQLNYVPFKGE